MTTIIGPPLQMNIFVGVALIFSCIIVGDILCNILEGTVQDCAKFVESMG